MIAITREDYEHLKSMIQYAFAPVPKFLTMTCLETTPTGVLCAIHNDPPLPPITYPAIEASRLGWSCVKALETVEARRKWGQAWRKISNG